MADNINVQILRLDTAALLPFSKPTMDSVKRSFMSLPNEIRECICSYVLTVDVDDSSPWITPLSNDLRLESSPWVTRLATRAGKVLMLGDPSNLPPNIGRSVSRLLCVEQLQFQSSKPSVRLPPSDWTRSRQSN